MYRNYLLYILSMSAFIIIGMDSVDSVKAAQTYTQCETECQKAHEQCYGAYRPRSTERTQLCDGLFDTCLSKCKSVK